MLSELSLYAANTANGYKALIPLHEFDCEYQLQLIDLVKGEQYEQAFMRLSPVGRIPVIAFEVDGKATSIYGSEAIALFLADQHGRFIPDDKTGRAKVIEMTGLISSDLALPLAVQFQVDVIVEGDHPAVTAYFAAQAQRLFANLDTALQDQQWLAGSEYSVADMLAYPSVAISATRLPKVLDGLEALQAWRDRVAGRPAVQQAMAVNLG